MGRARGVGEVAKTGWMEKPIQPAKSVQSGKYQTRAFTIKPIENLIGYYYISVIILLGVSSCSKGYDKLQEVTDKQSQVASDNQVKADNENLKKKSQAMEDDLAKRQRFYQVVSGTYEGTLKDTLGTVLNVRLTLVPSRVPYHSDRVRQLEEIADDLNNLYLKVHVVQSDSSHLVASGCVFDNIRPNLVKGEINLASESCPHVYTLLIGEDSAESHLEHGSVISSQESRIGITSKILEGTISSIENLAGYRQSVKKSTIYELAVKRISEPRPSEEYPVAPVDEDQAKQIRQMEEDLKTRQRFYSAIQGTYEGTFLINGGQFRIRFTLVPSLPPYPSAPRTRTLEEVTSDLTNLYLKSQVVQWNPADPLSAVGCRIENIRPDLNRGEITLATENCPSFYRLRLAEDPKIAPAPSVSSEIALQVLSGKITEVGFLVGQMQPTTNAAVYSFNVSKIKE